ncbi:hypothetical protein S40288_11792 [Stachybotrys chartarum IBT 40288]|nr:hypothetical protein S40288_11792 [Stachybotrys chartarum IBT 40288]
MIIDNLRDGVMAEAGLDEQMADRSEQRWPTDLELTPADHTAMQRLLMYTSVSLILNRLMRPVAEIICAPVSQIDVEHRRLSELVWCCLPRIRRLSPVSLLFFQLPLALSLEAALGDSERVRMVIVTLMRLGMADDQEITSLQRMVLASARLWTQSAVQPQFLNVDGYEEYHNS